MLAVRVANKQATVVTINIGKFLARLPDCRGIDYRQHLFQMLRNQTEVERFVVVLNGAQMDVFLKVTMALLVLAIDPLQLILNGFHLLRQQANQVKR